MSTIKRQNRESMLPSEKLQLGHEAVMLEDARQVLRNARKETEQHREWAQGTSANAGDDMLVLGDHTTHVYPPVKTDWGKILMGAGLLATGVGTPVGGLMIMQGLLNKPESSVLQAPVKEVNPLPMPKFEDHVIDWELGGGQEMVEKEK